MGKQDYLVAQAEMGLGCGIIQLGEFGDLGVGQRRQSQGFGHSTCISHAWHIHFYLKYRIMPTKGGKRMGGSDFMASSLT
jgi:hypothetical protein